MNPARFIQIHLACLLSRSLIKPRRRWLGQASAFRWGHSRRVSSQSLKRHWRLAGADSLETPQAIRGRCKTSKSLWGSALSSP